jgi:hypothetical protein
MWTVLIEHKIISSHEKTKILYGTAWKLYWITVKMYCKYKMGKIKYIFKTHLQNVGHNHKVKQLRDIY